MSDEIYSDITHVIFDLDGLLIDTETCYTTATNNVTQKYGKQFTWDLKSKVMGMSPIESSLTVINELDIPLDVNEYLKQISDEFSIAIKDVDLMSGAEELVKHFDKHRIPMSIATGSNTQSFATKIQKFDHFFTKNNYFHHYVLAADDPNVKRGKPFPDVFIESMKRFGADLEPKNVLVFEDSPAGVEAAFAAGMKCVMVPDPRVDATQQKATLILESLNHFKPEQFSFPPFTFN